MSAADRFDPAALIDQARQWAGSDDFGTDLDENETWRDGLGRLCDGFVAEARLNDLGVEIAALDLVRALKNRLQIVDWRKAHPEIAEEKIQNGRSSSSGSPAPAPRSCSTCSPRTPPCGRR